MLICPECQTENLERNKYCDQCGTSLIHKNCVSCGEKITYDDLECPDCGAVNVQSYQCIVSAPKGASIKVPFPCLTDPEIDPTARYLLRKPITIKELTPFLTTEAIELYKVSVIDKLPLQKSSLDTTLEIVEGFDRQSLMDAGIPPLAFPYLTLADYGEIIPELLDAWRSTETGQEIVIIPERQNWQTITEYWQQNDLDTERIFVYLKKFAKLWKSFIKVKCCGTLLHLDNIGVDQDNNLQLQKIYLDSVQNPPQLKELVETWITLLETTEREELPFITKLIVAIEEGKIENIKQLIRRLDRLFQEAQVEHLPLVTNDQDISEGEEILPIPAEEELNEIVEQFDFDEEEVREEKEITEKGEPKINNSDDQPTVVLPMRILSLVESGLTDIGRRRGHNEDFFAIRTDIKKQETPKGTFCQAKGCFIVCDGMGGHAAGEVASSMAVTHLYKYFEENWQDQFPSVDMIKDGILETNNVIYSANMDKGNTGAGRMGTTLVMAIVDGTRVAIAHVGDSRIYRVTRKWGLEQLTVDHSVAYTEIKHGVDPELAFARPDAFQLTQALGPRDNTSVHPDVNFIDIKEDTLIIMCSDGLSDNQLIEDNWESHFLPLISSKSNLEEGLLQIIDLGNQVNGHDNITCVLIRIKVQPNLDSHSPLN